MEKKKKDIKDLLNKRIRHKRIERIVYLIGLIVGMILGIKILIGMVTMIN